MKRLLLIIPALAAGLALLTTTSCDDDNTWSDYTEWREANNDWLTQQEALVGEDGMAYYERVLPEWNKSAYVLMHFYNDRSKTQGNLTPMYTSTVSVKYIGKLYNDVAFDSSFTAVDSLFTTSLRGVVSGWTIALQQMHVGDSARVVIPYQQGYGANSQGSIPPYSTLQFDIKLVDIPAYETKY